MVKWMMKEWRHEEGRRVEGYGGAVVGCWGAFWVCSTAPLVLGSPGRNLASSEFQPRQQR